jgi:hypothetical protein
VTRDQHQHATPTRNVAAISSAPRRDRPYRAGRSRHWVKVKNRKHLVMSRVMEAA